MFVTVSNYYNSKEEQMRMSQVIRAKSKDDACNKQAAMINPAYKLVGHERWFDIDASARKMTQAVYRLPEPVQGYMEELKVAAWTK